MQSYPPVLAGLLLESCPSADGTTSRLLGWPGHFQRCFSPFCPLCLVDLQAFFVLSETHFPEALSRVAVGLSWALQWVGWSWLAWPAPGWGQLLFLLQHPGTWQEHPEQRYSCGSRTSACAVFCYSSGKAVRKESVISVVATDGRLGVTEGGGTCAPHFMWACCTPWSFPQALHGVSFSWVALKHRNLSGLKERLNDESVGSGVASSSVGRASLS